MEFKNFEDIDPKHPIHQDMSKLRLIRNAIEREFDKPRDVEPTEEQLVEAIIDALEIYYDKQKPDGEMSIEDEAKALKSIVYDKKDKDKEKPSSAKEFLDEYVKELPKDKEFETDEYLKNVKTKLGETEYEKVKDEHTKVAIQHGMESNKESFLAKNKDAYAEYLRGVFQPEQGKHPTSAEIVNAKESMIYTNIQMGIELKRGATQAQQETAQEGEQQGEQRQQTPGQIIFKVRIGNEWKEIAKKDAEDQEVQTGTTNQRDRENKILQLAKQLLPEIDQSGQVYAMDRDYEVNNSELRREYAQELHNLGLARQLSHEQEQGIDENA